MKTIIMIRFTYFIAFLLYVGILSAQDKVYEVYYYSFSDGKANPDTEYKMTFSKDIAYLSAEDAKIRSFIDFKNRRNVTLLNYNDNIYLNEISFDSLPKYVKKEDTDEILGYKCKLATYKAFSNTIDVWYCDTSELKGSPYNNYLPDNSVALKVVINGNRVFKADSIAISGSDPGFTFPVDNSIRVSDSEFEELKIRSRYKTISVFENDTINFDPGYWSLNSYNSNSGTYHHSKGAVILKRINVPDEIKKGAYIYATLTCSSAGDAYDRTGSVFLIPDYSEHISMLNAFKDSLETIPVFMDNTNRQYQGIVATADYSPVIELMRFFTSFGAGHFNNLRVINNYPWEEEVIYKSEVTSVFPVDNDYVWIGVFIGNYDKGGHRVSLDLDVYPAYGVGMEVRRTVVPLFNTVNIMEMSGQEYGRLFKNDTLEVNFTIEDTLRNPQLIFTSTGHGGWGGGDEFNPKLNQLFLNDKPLFSVIPWRTDCATYRLLNPASGNFGNGLSSSDLSRSNWCPGTLTPPYIIKMDGLLPGNHNIKVVIDQGDDSGGSFNHWSVSGVITGTK